ncbi:MAG: GPW/gp25 family protein [Crocinitomicaceae bacterium]|nr:GPW/gp25 family protein [Crocinitomicaceae bacterium]
MKKKSFIGSGWSFPPTFTKNEGIVMVSEEEEIAQSIEILLNTSIGERIMQPKFGCDLKTYLFQSISTSKLHFVKEMIRTALLNYEARIKLIDINIDHTKYLDGIINVTVNYEVAKTNSRFNLVFPFYKVEGTDLPVNLTKINKPLSA